MMWSACTEILIHRAEIEAAAKGNVCVDRALCLLVFSDTLSRRAGQCEPRLPVEHPERYH
jgi:hypothetical protein